MSQITVHHMPEAHYLSEQRKNLRHEAINILAITERGTGQILDISREGLSFGCLYPHNFPEEFHVDILDAKGSHIKKLKVRKMRETNSDYQDPPAIFELVVGVEFCELTSSQSDELNYLIDNMEMFDYPYTL
ncbi:MAG: hypothetical protein WBB19_09195 [Desulforhopalus sp.]